MGFPLKNHPGASSSWVPPLETSRAPPVDPRLEMGPTWDFNSGGSQLGELEHDLGIAFYIHIRSYVYA